MINRHRTVSREPRAQQLPGTNSAGSATPMRRAQTPVTRGDVQKSNEDLKKRAQNLQARRSSETAAQAKLQDASLMTPRAAANLRAVTPKKAQQNTGSMKIPGSVQSAMGGITAVPTMAAGEAEKTDKTQELVKLGAKLGLGSAMVSSIIKNPDLYLTQDTRVGLRQFAKFVKETQASTSTSLAGNPSEAHVITTNSAETSAQPQPKKETYEEETERVILRETMGFKPTEYKVEKVETEILVCHGFAFGDGNPNEPNSPQAVIDRAKGNSIAVCFSGKAVGHTARHDASSGAGDKVWLQSLQNQSQGSVIFRTNQVTLEKGYKVIVYTPGREDEFKRKWKDITGT